ncbi:hypothetical protein NJH83_16925 [Pseudomonas chlororaphis]|uniref:hypothetical protein n=1 Tax=Pseudomonas chlororaphis TaxID=587753 RepID=UPI00209BA2EA|nr:hypothetical protein [Pseudomonas chlororaphis]MCO7611923.1 hypothetical protein [Pseudomonas chlororaphis]
MGEFEAECAPVVSERNFLDVLCALEKKHDVSSLRYKGTHYWPILRMLLGFENDPLVPPSQGKTGTKERFKKYLHALSSLFENFIDPRNNQGRSGRCDVYYLTHSTCRSLKIQGKYFDAFFSPLRHWCDEADKNIDFYAEEFVPGAEYRRPRSEKTTYIQKYLTLISFLGGSKSRSTELEESDIALIENLKIEIESQGFSAHSINFPAIKKTLTQFDLHKERFSKVLKSTQPKIVLVVTYYNIVGFSLMAAANALDIKTLDLQHGVQGPGHFAYGSWGRVPEGGWDMLPRLFWNWTPEDVANVNSWGGEAHTGILGGRIFSQYLSEMDVEFSEYKTLTSRIKNSGCTQVVLITLQPIEREDFIQALLNAMQSIECESVFWLFRLHPTMMEKQTFYSVLFENQYSDLALCSNLPLDYVLKLADLHITLNSSVTIEAALEGVPTLLDHNCSYYMDWQNLGIARRIEENQTWGGAIAEHLKNGNRFLKTQDKPSAKKTILELTSS